jgi:hypothetical protein
VPSRSQCERVFGACAAGDDPLMLLGGVNKPGAAAVEDGCAFVYRYPGRPVWWHRVGPPLPGPRTIGCRLHKEGIEGARRLGIS